MSSRKPSSLSNLLARLSHRSSKTPRLGDRLSTSNPDLVSTNIGDPPSYRAADDPDQAAPDYPSSPRPPPYDPPLGPPTSDPNYLGQLNRYNSATISVAKLEQSLVEFESQLTQYRTKWVKENPTKHADRFRALLIHLSKEEYNARRTSVDLAKTEMNLTKEVTEYFVKARPTLPISANPPSKSRKHVHRQR